MSILFVEGCVTEIKPGFITNIKPFSGERFQRRCWRTRFICVGEKQPSHNVIIKKRGIFTFVVLSYILQISRNERTRGVKIN